MTFEGDGVHPKRLHRNHQIEISALNVTMPLGYCAILVTDATMADVLLAGMVLTAFGAWRRWGWFRGEKNLNKRSWFSPWVREQRERGTMRVPVATGGHCQTHHKLRQSQDIATPEYSIWWLGHSATSEFDHARTRMVYTHCKGVASYDQASRSTSA